MYLSRLLSALAASLKEQMSSFVTYDIYDIFAGSINTSALSSSTAKLTIL